MGRGDGFELDLLGEKIVVGYVPMRKSVCLTLVNGSVHTTVAYFRSEEDAEKFIKHMSGATVRFQDRDGH